MSKLHFYVNHILCTANNQEFVMWTLQIINYCGKKINMYIMPGSVNCQHVLFRLFMGNVHQNCLVQ